MLFKDEKREPIRIKAKPGIIELAEELYKTLYPYASEANLDDLFEQLITVSAEDLHLVQNNLVVIEEEKPKAEEVVEAENAATLEVGELLGN